MADTRRSRKKPNPKTPPRASSAVSRDTLEEAPGPTKVPLQLRLSPELRREVRVYAAAHDLQLSALFEQVWAFYREHHE